LKQGSYQQRQLCVSGANPLLFNPNWGCFNPQAQTVLKPAAWTDPAPGQWGTAAPFYNNVRWQRQPAESLSFGRNFRFGREGRNNFFVRAEFQNIFNRLFLSTPQTGNQGGGGLATILTPVTVANGVNTAGYGYVNTVAGPGHGWRPADSAPPRTVYASARETVNYETTVTGKAENRGVS
jgi:hypothetical protein